MNDHRQIGLKVADDALDAIVERYVEQPSITDIELHQSLVGNVGGGGREGIRAWRDHAQRS